MIACRNRRETCHDDTPQMRFSRPYGGARGQQVTRGDAGWWRCEVCDLSLTPNEAGVLLDAVLMLSEPNCDSIHDGLHADVQVAFAGGGLG